MKKILTIDIGGSSIKYGKFDLSGRLLEKGTFVVPVSFSEMVNEIASLYESEAYEGLSISSPGAIDVNTGQGYGITAIEYLPMGGNLKSELERLLGINVAIENDANCAGISEIHFNPNLDCIAYIVLGSGVGGCAIVDGKVVHGSNYFGGEFGYMPYRDSEISAYAGMMGLSKRATESETIIPGLEVFRRYENGESSFVKAVNEYYDAIAYLIAMLNYSLNPQSVIFAGAVTNRSQFLGELNAAISRYKEKHPTAAIDDVQVIVGKFGSDANLYGAFANYIRTYM